VRALLAWRGLSHRPARTILAVLGVAVSTAMLLDMVMLASGMTSSFRDLLRRQGYDVRLAPKGTLPFDTEAAMAGASAIEAALLANPNVARVSPVLGTTVHVVTDSGAVPAFALGVRAAVQVDYEVLAGADAVGPGEVVLSDDLVAATGLAIGDSATIAFGYEPQLRTFTSARRFLVRGRARFTYLAAGQDALAMPLPGLQALGGRAWADRVSLFMVKLAAGADTAALRAAASRVAPQASLISTADAVASVERRLSYFRQLALILGTVSLIVGFLLVTTLVTVSVNERVGEIAVLRALGVSRPHVAQQVVLEGLALGLCGGVLGVALGLVTARYLNGILRTFPGLPAEVDFFVFDAGDAVVALGILLGTAVLAGVVPAWRAASLPIGTTLRAEAVG
jgi:putative ABC transport system permease protein